MVGKVIGAVVLATSLPASSAESSVSARMSPPCLSGLRAAFVHGHFTGPLVCSTKLATFIFVGRTAENKFSIYDYRYRYLPQHGSVMHGGQRLVLFHGRDYVGQYVLSPPPYADVTVSGARVIIATADDRRRDAIDLSRGPPAKILIGGEVETFFR